MNIESTVKPNKPFLNHKSILQQLAARPEPNMEAVTRHQKKKIQNILEKEEAATKIINHGKDGDDLIEEYSR